MCQLKINTVDRIYLISGRVYHYKNNEKAIIRKKKKFLGWFFLGQPDPDCNAGIMLAF